VLLSSMRLIAASHSAASTVLAYSEMAASDCPDC
jgi:hypothetical protein